MTLTALELHRPAAKRSSAPLPPVHPPHFVMTFTAACLLVVIVARLWFSTDDSAVNLSSQVLSVVSFVHGMTLFVILGRDRITMPGYFMASSAAIVGISGLLVIPDPYFMEGAHPEVYLNTALFVSVLTQIGIGALCLRLDSTGRPSPVILPPRTVRWSQVAGILMLMIAAVLGERLEPVLDGVGFSAILLICVATLLSPKGLQSIWNTALVLGALVAYPTLIISGTGRLRAIALILAFAYVFFLRYGQRWLKTVGVILAPILLAALGAWRKEYEVSLSGDYGNDTGLSSMFVAIGNFGSLIRDSELGRLPTLGASLLSPVRSALPDDLVPHWIPDAIGYELAALTDPELYGTGFSTVASIYGDLWWNFGALGLILGVPLLGFMLDRIDAWTIRGYRAAAQGSRGLLYFVFFAALLGGVGDIVWAGFHTWIVRMYARIAALLLLWVVSFYSPGQVFPTFVSFREPKSRAPSSDLNPRISNPSA